jgi:hypothetical protein
VAAISSGMASVPTRTVGMRGEEGPDQTQGAEDLTRCVEESRPGFTAQPRAGAAQIEWSSTGVLSAEGEHA